MIRWLFPVITLVLSLIVMLIIGEIVLRILGIGYGNMPTVPDPILEYRNPSNYSYTFNVPGGEIKDQRVVLDDEGLISAPYTNPDENRDIRYRIAFLGDSFVEAKHVSFTDSFVGILRDSSYSIAEVKNYGVSSYSPIAYLLQWRHQVRHFQPTNVFILFFSNDIEHDKRRAEIAQYDVNGDIKAVPGKKLGKIRRFMRKFYVARFVRKFQLQLKWALENRGGDRTVIGGVVEENPDITDLTAETIITLSQEISDSNGQLILMAVPSKYRLYSKEVEFSEPELSDKWKKWCEENNISFVDLVEPFREAMKKGIQPFFTKDIHFNEEGHKVAARTLMDLYPQIFSPLTK